MLNSINWPVIVFLVVVAACGTAAGIIGSYTSPMTGAAVLTILLPLAPYSLGVLAHLEENNWRFSLRALLIAMALVAVALWMLVVLLPTT
jgi:uncharacterized oligopeptide transporter (OPT) family protein